MKKLCCIILLFLFFNFTAIASPDCSRKANSLPNPELPPGQANLANPINHILVVVQENHSFDNYFGQLNDPRFYGKSVDGVLSNYSNLASDGHQVFVYPETNLCVVDPAHDWNSVHEDWDLGELDGFVKTNSSFIFNGDRVMGYFGPSDIPFYYGLANQFATADRYFSSALTQTYPNRFYLMAGTSFGHIANDSSDIDKGFDQKTIFDVLDEFNISWKYYCDDQGYLGLFRPMYLRNKSKIQKIKNYEMDLANDTLPSVVFLDSSFDGEDEHPNGNIQIGQAWTAKTIHSLMSSKSWKDSVLFLAYDENGGFYDHVAPPEACAPDEIPPMLQNDSVPGNFNRYGFRVPFVAVSPYVKHHYVSHSVFDHTSILKFIEVKFNLPALTRRDANADGFTDIFDFKNPVLQVKDLPPAVIDSTKSCN